jgi:hypothetical protein
MVSRASVRCEFVRDKLLIDNGAMMVLRGDTGGSIVDLPSREARNRGTGIVTDSLVGWLEESISFK